MLGGGGAQFRHLRSSQTLAQKRREAKSPRLKTPVQGIHPHLHCGEKPANLIGKSVGVEVGKCGHLEPRKEGFLWGARPQGDGHRQGWTWTGVGHGMGGRDGQVHRQHLSSPGAQGPILRFWEVHASSWGSLGVINADGQH